MKMTQSSEWVQKELPLAQPLGDCELRHTAFPFSLFSLPMSSAMTVFLPSCLKTFAGGRQKLFPKPLTW